MDAYSPSEDNVMESGRATAGTESEAAETARRMALFDRIMQASAEHATVDDLAQEFCVITAECFGGLCSIQLLNQQNEMVHLAGLYDVDPRALSLLEDAVVAMADMPRDDGAAGQVMLTGEPLLLSSIPEEALRTIVVPEFLRYVDQVGMATAMAVPLKGRSGNIGAVTVSRHRGSALCGQADLELLSAMAARISLSLENLLLINSLRAQISAVSAAEQERSVSEERFRSIFDSAALGIELMDPLGVVVDTNRAFENLTGFSRAEMVGRPFGTLQHPDHLRRVLQALNTIKMNKEVDAPIEARLLRKDGTWVWVKTHFAAVKMSANDQTPRFLAVLHEDITSRKQAEQYFEAVLEATPDALVMVDEAGTIMLVNRQMERLFGYGRDEVLGREVETLVPERLREWHPLHRAGYLQDPHIRPMGTGMELFAMRKDGSEIPVEISLSPLRLDEKTVVVAAIRDITSRKQKEAALIRSQRSLTEAQSVARLGSLEYDLVTGGMEASNEALRILGIKREQLNGSDTVREAMHPHDRQRVVDMTNQVLKSGRPAEFEFRVVRPDGSIRMVHDRVAPYFDPDGKPTRILGTIQDVTEQRQAEEDMAELKSHLQISAELERLRLAQELHDQPMQNLYGVSYRLEELREAADPEMYAALGELNEEIQGTISELRVMAKELRPPAISNFGLEKAIRSYVEDFQTKHPNIKLNLSLAKDHQLLPENIRLTLFRVFQQGLANVLRHSQASEVDVRFSLDAEEARLVVADNGLGFDVPSNWMGFVRQGHYGLAGAAERVNALGGILLVESTPRQRTTITAVVPWSRVAGSQSSVISEQ